VFLATRAATPPGHAALETERRWLAIESSV
jgi:hypothetical protein